VKFIPFSSSARPLAGEFRAQRISPSLPHDRRTRNRLSESLLPLVSARKNRQKSRRRNGFAGFTVGSPQVDPRHSSHLRVRTGLDHAPRRAIFGWISGERAKFSSQALGDIDGNNRHRTADNGRAAFDRGVAVLTSLSQEPISKSRQHPYGLPKIFSVVPDRKRLLPVSGINAGVWGPSTNSDAGAALRKSKRHALRSWGGSAERIMPSS